MHIHIFIYIYVYINNSTHTYLYVHGVDTPVWMPGSRASCYQLQIPW